MTSRLIVRVALGVAAGMALVIAMVTLQPPAWIVLLLGSMAGAGLYIRARKNSRYDPLDPRFGSCIPPPPRHRDP